MKWLENFYNWCNFKTNYDKIKAWHLSPEVDKLFEDTWNNLPKVIQDAIWNIIKKICEKYGQKVAEETLGSLLGSLRSQVR